MTRENIIERVKARIDELNPFTSEELNTGVNLIDSMLNDSTTTLLLTLPVHLIKPYEVDDYPSTHVQYQDGSGRIDLPDDFLRLHTFKMSTWIMAVHTPIFPGHPKYDLQKSVYTMGKENKPVVIIKNSLGLKQLNYYSVDPSNPRTIETYWHIPSLLPTGLEDELIPYLSWQCAADVLQILNEDKAAEGARSQLLNLIISSNQ